MEDLRIDFLSHAHTALEKSFYIPQTQEPQLKALAMEQGLANFCKPETTVKERVSLCSDKTLFMDIDIWISYSFQVSQTIIFLLFFFQPFFLNVKTILDSQTTQKQVCWAVVCRPLP